MPDPRSPSSQAPPLAANVALVVDETEAEGPGKRMAIWVQGCPFRCKGCCNPEMLDDKPADIHEVAKLLERFAATDVEGISLLGGEPFAQPAPLAALAEGVQKRGGSVMVFTGYRLDELKERGSDAVDALLHHTDILVDGRYEQELRTTDRRWVGSSNQVMHFLSERYSANDPQFSAPNTVELRLQGNIVTINGWPLNGAKTGDFLRRRKDT